MKKQKTKKLKNHWYLTPSKASMLAQGDFSFLQNYLIGEKPEQKEAMTKGNLVHKIFYDLIKADNELEKSNLITAPDKWPTKKESGMLQEEYKKKWYADRAEEGKIIYTESLKPVINAIQIALELNDDFMWMRKNEVEFETPLETERYKMAGILDIKSKMRIEDIKTTSKAFSTASEFIKWNEKGFAVQQITYEKLAQENGIETTNPFVFRVIQLSWPYQIMNIQLEPHFVEEIRKWFVLDIYPRWRALWARLEETFGKYPFQKPETLEARIETWARLQGNKIYDFNKIHVAKPSGYFSNELRKDILRLEDAISKRIK